MSRVLVSDCVRDDVIGESRNTVLKVGIDINRVLDDLFPEAGFELNAINEIRDAIQTLMSFCTLDKHITAEHLAGKKKKEVKLIREAVKKEAYEAFTHIAEMVFLNIRIGKLLYEQQIVSSDFVLKLVSSALYHDLGKRSSILNNPEAFLPHVNKAREAMRTHTNPEYAEVKNQSPLNKCVTIAHHPASQEAFERLVEDTLVQMPSIQREDLERQIIITIVSDIFQAVCGGERAYHKRKHLSAGDAFVEICKVMNTLDPNNKHKDFVLLLFSLIIEHAIIPHELRVSGRISSIFNIPTKKGKKLFSKKCLANLHQAESYKDIARILIARQEYTADARRWDPDRKTFYAG